MVQATSQNGRLCVTSTTRDSPAELGGPFAKTGCVFARNSAFREVEDACSRDVTRATSSRHRPECVGIANLARPSLGKCPLSLRSRLNPPKLQFRGPNSAVYPAPSKPPTHGEQDGLPIAPSFEGRYTWSCSAAPNVAGLLITAARQVRCDRNDDRPHRGHTALPAPPP